MTVYLYVLSKSGGHDMGGAGRRRVVFCDRAIIILQVFKYVSISFSNIVTICVYMSITYIYIYIYRERDYNPCIHACCLIAGVSIVTIATEGILWAEVAVTQHSCAR